MTKLQTSFEQHEGVQTPGGGLCVSTGSHTARSANSKYIVQDTDIPIHFNEYNKPLDPNLFNQYWLISSKHLETQCHRGTYQVGNHPELNIHVDVETHLNWHQVFASYLFLSPKNTPLQHWTLRCCPNLTLSPQHETLVAISFKEQKVLICGTAYAGEIKKSMFTVMNAILPSKNVLPLHCSAILTHQHNTSLILGLSGTGKTTLSSSDSFKIIGDDEHGWGNHEVFNLEGGCYAKVANIQSHSEPQIYQATRQACIFENVVLNNDCSPNFNDTSITENTRCAYPLSFLPKVHQTVAPGPQHVIMLSCDLYGVLPALSLLTPRQAKAMFLLGYTARVGCTEHGAKGIQPITSACFGEPFFPLSADHYANLFEQKLLSHNVKVWLVNTGWTNGDGESGLRYPIETTKDIINTIVNNQIQDPPTGQCKTLGLNFYTQLPNGTVLLPDQVWIKSQLYKKHINTLSNILNEVVSVKD